jgi:hypothetical protein
MIGKCLAVAAAPFLLSAAEPTIPMLTYDRVAPSPFRGSFEVVPLVKCTDSLGSAVRISDDVVISAAHVTDGEDCEIDGEPMQVVYTALGVDFTAARVKMAEGYVAIVSCEGIIPGERYYAFGHALGGKPNVEPLIGTNKKYENGGTSLRGRVFPGMSGGMVANAEGAFVAITIQYNDTVDESVVVSLKDTKLCA